jgi:hypothetical protein
MKFQITTDHFGDIEFSGSIPRADIVGLELDPLDRRLLTSCGDNAADILLGLEMLFRREQERLIKQENSI